MKRLLMEPSGWSCTLAECPPGFFVCDDSLCFKTEYGAVGSFNEAGEHFVSDPATTEVQPVEPRWEYED
jgi:hypothetical protein